MRRQAKLNAEKRDGTGKEAATRLRNSGRIPAILYGRGAEPMPLSVEAHEAGLLFQSISVENTIVDLDIAGDTPVQALIREIQAHPYKPHLLHVDFLLVRAGETVEVEVPVHLKGSPAGVKLGGVLQHTIHELRVRCLPTAIPEAIDLDVSALEIGDSIHVRDVPEIEGVQIMADPDQTLCSVVVQRAEEVKPVADAALGDAAAAAPEAEED